MTINQIAFSLPKRTWRENSRIVVPARFLDRATGDETPTNIHYRVDDPETGRQITGWTSVSAANPASITITPAQNKCEGCHDERRQLTVAADYGLASQFVETIEYTVENIGGVT